MANSLLASEQGLEIIDQARRKKGWNKDAPAWIDAANDLLKDTKNGSVSRSTLQRFWRCKPIRQENFKAICKALGIDNWEKIVDENSSPKQSLPENFFAYDSSWVGRDKLITQLSQKLRNSCRLLLILGLTGIGKTALAERSVIELQDLIQGDWKNKLLRANFDYDEKATDFASIAARWLEGLGEQISPAEKKPELLLNRLVGRLQDNRFIVLIDSMERLLTENEDGSWGDFSDKYWEKFFLRLLSAESGQSRLIVTSQDLPVNLHSKASRYNNFYQRQILYGLDKSEQKALFDVDRNCCNEKLYCVN